MSEAAPLVLAIPSKGRLKEQVDGWLAGCGFTLETEGGERGYRATLRGLPGAEVRLMSAADIALALNAGEIHLGVTGEDLLRETGALEARISLLRGLGFGRADLVVAAPQSWIDVDAMADVEAVAQLYLSRTGSRLRVATKYAAQTRAFFAAHGVADYRIVDSGGATEGAPAAGLAELVVDITTTGATLASNNLKILSDGVILRSEAQLAAAVCARWTAGQLASARRLAHAAQARAGAKGAVILHWPPALDGEAASVVPAWVGRGATPLPSGLLARAADLLDVTAALAEAGVGPVSVSRLDYVFEASCPEIDALAARVAPAR